MSLNEKQPSQEDEVQQESGQDTQWNGLDDTQVTRAIEEANRRIAIKRELEGGQNEEESKIVREAHENTRMENFLGQRGLIKPGLINKFIKFSDPNLGYQTVRNENTRMENFFGQAGLIKPRTDGKVSQASEKHAGENENQKVFLSGRFHRGHAEDKTSS